MKEIQERYDLPKGWIWTTLEDISFKLTDGSHNPPKKKEDGIPMLSARNIEYYNINFNKDVRYINQEDYRLEIQRTNIEKGDILLTIVGSIGRVALVDNDKKFAIQRSVALIKPVLVSGKYLMYYLSSPFCQKFFTDNATGTAQKGIYLNKLKRMYVPLVPLEEQEKIVLKIEEILSSLEKSKDQLSNSLKELDNYQISVLNNIFDRKSFKNILPEIESDNWKCFKLEEVCLKITDGSHYSPKAVTEGYSYITVKDVQEDMINFQDSLKIAEEDYLKLENNGCRPAEGDVLFSKDGTVGKVSLINFDKKFVVLSSLAIIRADQQIIRPKLLYYILKSPKLLNQALDQKKGVAIRRIVLRDLKKLKIDFPSKISDQDLIITKLDAIISHYNEFKREIEKRIEQIDLFKKTFLKEIFEGKYVEFSSESDAANKLLEKVALLKQGYNEKIQTTISNKRKNANTKKSSFLETLAFYFSKGYFSTNEIKDKFDIPDEMLKNELFSLLESKSISSYFDEKEGVILYKLER
jgi:type I restriction enzyme S subunit